MGKAPPSRQVRAVFVVEGAAVWGEPQQLSLDGDGARTVPMVMGD